MNTKQEVASVIDDFVAEYQGKFEIWGISVGKRIIR